MHNTRQKIIEVLNRRKNASAVDLARILRLTPSNIRHHLSILEKEGVIRIIAERLKPIRGRPSLLYTLSTQADLHNLDALASASLCELLDNLPLEEHPTLLKHLAERLAVKLPPSSFNVVERFNLAIEFLNKMHYSAGWEARHDAPRILFRHCPYAAIISEHPELCHLDEFLLSALLKEPVEQTAKLKKDNQGLHFCSFILLR